MRIEWTSADFAMTNGKVPVLRIRSDETIIVDGENVEPDDNGLSTVVLSADQTAAFVASVTPDATSIELPDGGHRGKPTVRGSDLAAFLAASRPAPDTESAANGKAK